MNVALPSWRTICIVQDEFNLQRWHRRELSLHINSANIPAIGFPSETQKCSTHLSASELNSATLSCQHMFPCSPRSAQKTTHNQRTDSTSGMPAYAIHNQGTYNSIASVAVAETVSQASAFLSVCYRKRSWDKQPDIGTDQNAPCFISRVWTPSSSYTHARLIALTRPFSSRLSFTLTPSKNNFSSHTRKYQHSSLSADQPRTNMPN